MKGESNMNQATEIFEYIKTHPGADVQEIADGTEWNRHVVEVATKIMVERGMIRETGRTECDDPKYELVAA